MDLISILLFSLRIFLGFVFFNSGKDKVKDGITLQHDIEAYQLLPISFSRSLAKILPIAEICIGVLLFVGAASTIVGLLGCLLLTVFLVAIIVNLVRGRSNDCGCHGPRKREPISPSLVFRNLGLIISTAPIILFGGGKLSSDYLFLSRKDTLAPQVIIPLLLIFVGMYTLHLLTKQLKRFLQSSPY